MGRPKKFRQPRNISFTVEAVEHRALRIKAAKKGKSVSAFIRALALRMIRNE
jgi:plasmid stability protein